MKEILRIFRGKERIGLERKVYIGIVMFCEFIWSKIYACFIWDKFWGGKKINC